MIFYLIPAGAGRPCELAGTQADARRVAKEHGFPPLGWEEHNVPTDKAGLMDYVNDWMKQATSTYQQALGGSPPTVVETDTNERPMNPDVGVDEDGHPKRRSGFTSTQVETCRLEKRSDHVQDLCYHVSKLTSGKDLGLVALEVAAKFTQIGEEASA